MDEVFIRIRGKQHYLWRAIDQNGGVLDILFQSWRNKTGDCQEFRVRACCDQVSVNRSSNRMASWVFAMLHSRGGIFQSLETWFKTRNSSLSALLSGMCNLMSGNSAFGPLG